MRWMLVLLLLVAFVGCYGSAGPEFEAFALEYVESVYNETDLYKRYTSDADRRVVEGSRSNMTADFEVTGWDYAGSGNYEYGVKFSNGATGVVTVYEQEGEIKAASIIVGPPRKE